MSTVPAVLSQHATEASFLWELRRQAISAPHYKLSDLANLDGRADAHLDGLRIAGDDGWRLCSAELRWNGPGAVFAAGVLALESGDENRVEGVVSLGIASDEASRALVSAMGWLPYRQARDPIRRFVADEDSTLRRIGVAAAAIHRDDAGEALAAAAHDDDPLLRARALRAIGELGRADVVALARKEQSSHDGACRAAAAWTVARLAAPDRPLDAGVVDVLRDAVETSLDRYDRCLQMLVRRVGHSAAHELIRTWSNCKSTSRAAMTAAGILGDPAFVPWLIDRLDTPPLARLAGEAITMITGLAINERPFEGEWPEGFIAGPTEDPQDENVAMDPDENLPWPDAEKIAAWWAEHRGDFTPGSRYLLGRPLTEEWLEDVLRNGYQRQRAAAALELAIRHPGQPLFEVRAPGFRQQELLGLK